MGGTPGGPEGNENNGSARIMGALALGVFGAIVLTGLTSVGANVAEAVTPTTTLPSELNLILPLGSIITGFAIGSLGFLVYTKNK